MFFLDKILKTIQSIGSTECSNRISQHRHIVEDLIKEVKELVLMIKEIDAQSRKNKQEILKRIEHLENTINEIKRNQQL